MSTPIAWDLETHLIRRGCTAPKMVCMSEYQEGGEPKLMLREEGLDRIEYLLKHEHSINQTLFDAAVASAEREHILPLVFQAIDEGRLSCIRIREMMIQNAKGELKFVWDEEKEEFKRANYQLSNMVQKYKGYSIAHKKKGDDVWRMRYNELDGVPLDQWPEEASQYAIDDAIETSDIWREQDRQELEGDSIPGYVSQMQAAWALYLTGTHGFRTDPDEVQRYKTELQQQFAQQIEICQKFGFRRTGAKTSRDLKAIIAAVESWYADHDQQPRLTPKDNISTDREQLTNTDHPGLLAVAESIRLEKQLTTYIRALEYGTVVPLNPNYNALIETYRTSCSGGMKIDGAPVGMNVQNLPRKGGARRCVVPRPGWVFAFCDLDTVEMRSLAQVCLDHEGIGFSMMAEAIKAGADTHVMLASELLDMPYSDAKALYDAGDKLIDKERQDAKVANYGFMGGMGADTFVDYAKSNKSPVTRDKAVQLHGSFRRTWPEMVPYLAHAGWMTRDGNATFISQQSGMVRGDCGYTQMANTPFQHLAAMAAKASLYQTCKECYIDAGSPLFGCRPWLFAHDEIGIEIPEFAWSPEQCDAAAMRLQQIMIEETQKWHPDVPIGASVAMSRRWYKGAKGVRVNGLLVPVQPAEQDGKTIWVPDPG